ncbi:MAG: ribonuclease H family protein [Ignavibacteria bacterium]|nr:ribonuclease H family protein [Ignavibacteria bacterium]
MKQQKYYVVWQGRIPGIYESWPACKEQIDGFADAKYKSFLTREDAAIAFNQSYTRRGRAADTAVPRTDMPLQDAYCVDAACSGNPGIMEYRCVKYDSREIIFRSKKYPYGTNNIGEFLAVVHCLARLQKEGLTNPIYTDSANALSWVRQKRCKTKLERVPEAKELFEVIAKAEKWLRENSFRNELLKWDTVRWGEIPADFGRK